MEERRLGQHLCDVAVEVAQYAVHGGVGGVQLSARRLDAQSSPRVLVHTHR